MASLQLQTLDVSKLSLKDERKPILTGKQEHYLKRELISHQVKWEIEELSSPTALQRFGAPFRSDKGEVAPEDSELPILRYLFVNHVRNFPFLDQAKEKDFWQDRLQTFLESFAIKRISSSEDRLEETKRRKLALKAQKLVELMMVSGIPTASGYEERIKFSEMEVVERGAVEEGLLVNVPEGHWLNGYDVNVCAIRQVTARRHIKSHTHAEFLVRTRRENKPDVVVARRYGAFVQLHRSLKTELPGKILPGVPRKEDSSQSAILPSDLNGDDASSVSSYETSQSSSGDSGLAPSRVEPPKKGHQSTPSRSSGFFGFGRSKLDVSSTSVNTENMVEPTVLIRETQRISLRAFLRALLADSQIAKSKAMREFLFEEPVTMTEEDKVDESKRKEMDHLRVEEQKRFYEIASQRARDLDVYMESFRRDIVENNGLTKLFAEIRHTERLEDLSDKYKKFAEWLRIEVAATIYHIFLAEDNSPEVFAQAKRIHSLVPYTVLKNVIRVANPAMVMTGVLDLFLASPFGSRSLLQRIIGMAIGDGVKQFQRAIEVMSAKVNDDVLATKIKAFVDADDDVRDEIKREAEQDQVDLIVTILRSEYLEPQLNTQQIEKVFNAYVAWVNAVENVDAEMKVGATLFANLKQLLKLYTRQRDKNMMLSIIEEPVTLKLFRDLFMIFYDPLIRVYKSANVYNSVTDFARFVDDMIQVVEKAQNHAMAADPNQTVQSFIDLCARHEEDFYRFVHEVHIHDNGLFDNLMGWLEGILQFLRNGPGKTLDMNRLFEEAVKEGRVDEAVAKKEIDSMIKYYSDRKRWHERKTREKMAQNTATSPVANGFIVPGPEHMFKSSDFGVDESDLDDLAYMEDDDDSEAEAERDDNNDDLLAAERKRRSRNLDMMRRRAGEPEKPPVKEILKLNDEFLGMLRQVLA